MISRMLTGLFVVALLAAEQVPGRAEWTFMPPDPPPGGEASLESVDGTSFANVWAVGAWYPAARRCLIERFNGISWTQFPTPDDPSNDGVLRGVVAISPDHAIAVGTHTPVGYWAQPLVMEWVGSDWELVPSPEHEGGRVFSAVDHTSTGVTWVAGHDAGIALLARRDGENWEINFAPPVGGLRNRFYAMHARTDNEIWVVGTQSDQFGEFEILLQRFNGGSSWTTFDVPSPGPIDEMNGVLAFAEDDAWAVGHYYHIPLYLPQPLVMHYDGTSWMMVDLPDYPEGPARLEAITATASDDVYAAGTYGTADGTPRPFMLHYDGASWSEVILPPTGGSNEWFRGMAATPDGAVWAVGAYYDGASTEGMAFVNPAGTISVSVPSEAPLDLWSAPTPFRSGTFTYFSLDRPGHVGLRVWDASGRLVRTLVEWEMQAGHHAVPWNGLDSEGQPVPSGVYFYSLDAERGTARRRVIRVR